LPVSCRLVSVCLCCICTVLSEYGGVHVVLLGDANSTAAHVCGAVRLQGPPKHGLHGSHTLADPNAHTSTCPYLHRGPALLLGTTSSFPSFPFFFFFTRTALSMRAIRVCVQRCRRRRRCVYSEKKKVAEPLPRFGKLLTRQSGKVTVEWRDAHTALARAAQRNQI
jgi:hypothetical protein